MGSPCEIYRAVDDAETLNNDPQFGWTMSVSARVTKHWWPAGGQVAQGPVRAD